MHCKHFYSVDYIFTFLIVLFKETLNLNIFQFMHFEKNGQIFKHKFTKKDLQMASKHIKRCSTY